MAAEYTLTLFLVITIFFIMTGFLWKSACAGSSVAWFLRPFLLYIGFAFVLKSLVLTQLGWDASIEAGNITAVPSSAQELDILIVNLVYVAGILFGIAIAKIVSPFKRPFRRNQDDHDLILIPISWYWIFYGIVALKFLVAMLFGWGRPAVDPAFSIPLFTGFVNIMSRDGLTTVFMIFTAIFAHSPTLYRASRGTYLIIVLIYIVSDLLLGWKSGLVFGIMGLLYVLFSAARNGNLGYIRFTVIGIAASVAFPFIYAFTHIFRFVRLDENLSMLDAALKTLTYTEAGASLTAGSEITPLLSFFLRITGVEGIAAAVTLQNFDMQLSDLFFKTDVIQRYTVAITGNVDGIFAIGGTIAGSVYLICSGESFCAFFVVFIINMFLFLAIFSGLSIITKMRAVSVGTAFSLSLVTIHMQLTTGALISFIERMIIVFAVAVLMNYVFRRGKPRTLRKKFVL